MWRPKRARLCFCFPTATRMPGSSIRKQLRGLAKRAAEHRVTTSTIGIGLGYDEAILTELAAGGNGNHSFGHGPDDAAAAVAAELDGLFVEDGPSGQSVD